MIKKGKECEAYLFEEITTDNDIELEVAMDDSMADSRVKTFSTLVLETWAVVFKNQHEIEEAEAADDETNVEADAYEGRIFE